MMDEPGADEAVDGRVGVLARPGAVVLGDDGREAEQTGWVERGRVEVGRRRDGGREAADERTGDGRRERDEGEQGLGRLGQALRIQRVQPVRGQVEATVEQRVPFCCRG